MATFNVAHLITLIGVGSIASSVVADEQQNQNKTQNGGGGLKHLLGSDVFTELRDKQNAMAEKMSGIETKLEKQIENGGGNFALMTMLTSNRLEKEIEDGMRENRNAMAEKMSGIEAKLEKQIENGMREIQTLLSTKLENQIENGMRENQNALAKKVSETEAKLENQIENVYTKLRDNQNASVTEMENRIENGIRENQNALAKKVSETEAKLENGMRENQNALAEKVSETEAKLENGMRENQNALAKKVSETEAKLENGIQNNQKALSLMKNMATLAFFHFPLPIYHRWNASDCDPEIVINESTNAIQHNGTEDIDWRSCRAWPIQMSSAVGRIGIIYAEYRILAIIGGLRIGLSTKEMPLDRWVGNGHVSYGYAYYGEIESTNTNGNRAVISENVPSFYTGEDVGVGLNWATRQLFFTKNGQRLNITNLYVDEGTADFYPTVTMHSHGDAVEANFGPNFKYDLSKKF